jgi:hypothetical protein
MSKRLSGSEERGAVLMRDVEKGCARCGAVIRIDSESGKPSHLQAGTWWSGTAGRNICLSRRLAAKDYRLIQVQRALSCALNRLKRYEDRGTTEDLYLVLDCADGSLTRTPNDENKDGEA